MVRGRVTRGQRHTDTREYPGAPEEYTATPCMKLYSSSAIQERWREGSSHMPTVSRTGLKEEKDSGVRNPGKPYPARIPSAAFWASTKLSLTTYIGSSVLSHCKIFKSVT